MNNVLIQINASIIYMKIEMTYFLLSTCCNSKLQLSRKFSVITNIELSVCARLHFSNAHRRIPWRYPCEYSLSTSASRWLNKQHFVLVFILNRLDLQNIRTSVLCVSWYWICPNFILCNNIMSTFPYGLSDIIVSAHSSPAPCCAIFIAV